MDAVLSIRATVVGVDVDALRARFISSMETGEFALSVTPGLARELAARLGDEMEIVALVSRGDDGTIGGALESFDLVEDGDPFEAWQEWYRSVSGP